MLKPRYYSNIYWHFTGGPVSNNQTNIWHQSRSLRDVKVHSSLKTPKEALGNLENILSSKTLKATSTEYISEEVETKKFCCVCDIPLNDLIYHRMYYGDYAIGFRAKYIHAHFHPVLYIDPYYASLNNTHLHAQKDDRSNSNNSHLWELLGIKKENPLINFLKITSFSSEYDHSFYGEREWRCLDDYTFSEEEVEAIIVPKEEVESIQAHLRMKGFHNKSVLSWDLIENV
ncbi:abortive infection system antitoxin AbiGi family protein [Aquibacillus koreensis]|uniref:Abortive infection system antitoxin AbiGi family protein n=1 Tax=Aquibacillus koreensis TaxID=279446 RepID=A0A9X3WK52_9BACI|nr:abortive infection system antitoxin AbiGi family protein [Aquibacillus koreensis]MCT2536402.1 abortive infection system antitoxin AbiGi family protein [Aquibacillus koreensis]MDC3421247.1 abortive infection system antitoxin AbiGi family protein [Aquibacillus koreensis]